MTFSMGAVKPSVAVLMAQRSGRPSRSRILNSMKRQEMTHGMAGEMGVREQPGLISEPQDVSEIAQGPHRLRARGHDEMILEAVEPGQEDDAGLIILCRRPEDEPRQGHCRRQQPCKRVAIALC